MIPIFQIDAFSDKVFGGNPAAVCPLQNWPADSILQNIAAENNLAETAFFCETDLEGVYDIRWFTPEYEVDLCGHATLATAFVIMNELEKDLHKIVFQTKKSGLLTVTHQGKIYTMDFPVRAPESALCTPEILKALGTDKKPVDCFKTHRDLFVVFDEEETIKAMQPDFGALKQTTFPWTCVTAKSSEPKVDFISRFFTSDSSVAEDPVTGSTHCTLMPYWAGKLNKNLLKAKQISARSGVLDLRLENDRVFISGTCKLYMRGLIEVTA